MPDTSLALRPARISYSHSVDIFSLPKDIRKLLRAAANEEHFGMQYDYVDGDYYVTPPWKDACLTELTDQELELLLTEGDVDSDEEAAQYDALITKFESETIIDTDHLSWDVALEIARRFIITGLPEAEKLMDEGLLAIYIWH